MDPFNTVGSYWDLAQQPTNFSTLADDDFLALLQKQFPSTLGTTAAAPSPKPPFDFSALASIPPDGGVDPQSITTFPLPNPSPPSSDSSPSPPSMNDPPSRPRSGANNDDHDDDNDDHTLKRKASDDSMDDEPSPKNPHSSSGGHSRKPSTSARRKSGNPHHDEIRLLKRKEQNRAAQRAFRERKEKHVKDLEDKVAALEAVNQEKQNENDNLRDLLSRLQSENMALKATSSSSPHPSSSAQSPTSQFTFSMPKPGMQMNMSSLHALSSYMTPHPPPPSMLSSPPASSFAASPAMSAASSSKSPPPPTPFDFNFGQLIPFDPASLSSLDDVPQTPQQAQQQQGQDGGAMSIDYGFGPMSGGLPYKTIASNPMFMSFGEPMDTSPSVPSSAPSPYGDWSAAGLQDGMAMASSMGGMGGGMGAGGMGVGGGMVNVDSLDQLFGGNYMGAQSPVDFSALLRSPPSSVVGLGLGGNSPIVHVQQHQQQQPNTFSSLPSSASTPGASSSSSSSGGPTASSSSSQSNGESPNSGVDMSCQVLGPALTSQQSPSNNNVHIMNGMNGAAGIEHNKDECPKTKDEMRQHIIQRGHSAFAPSSSTSPSSNGAANGAANGMSSMTTSPTPAPLSPSSIGVSTSPSPSLPVPSSSSLSSSSSSGSLPQGSTGSISMSGITGANIGFVRKVNGGGNGGEGGQGQGGNVVMCKGSSFPKTEMSDKNIEVLTAWRTITSNPQFKDVDINELCTEFTSKARCDGTKVVLEPEGVNHIMKTLAARKLALMQQGGGQQMSGQVQQN